MAIKRKDIRYIFMAACIVWLLPGCSPDSPAAFPEEEAVGAIYFTLGLLDGTETRALPQGSDNVHHVDYVQLYIFDGTDDNAPCIASENAEWAAYFQNNLPIHTAEMIYRVKYQGLQLGKAYTFLAVGVNTPGRQTFDVPAFIAHGATLGSLEAAWAARTTSTDMAQSELFAGKSVIIPRRTVSQGMVEMRRRVAGVMGWFSNVPATINGIPVGELRIALYTSQNTRMPLLQRQQSPVFQDFLLSPSTEADGQALIRIRVPDNRADIASGGSFVLPADMPPPSDGDAYTLRMELTDANGNLLQTRRILLPSGDPSDGTTGGGTGIIDPEGLSRFPIIANHFYSVGSKDAPIDVGGNNIIIVSINPDWDEINDDMDVVEKSRGSAG